MFVKYALEGLAVAMAVAIVARGKTSLGESLLLALSAMAVFLVLDMYAPLTSAGTRQGAGFGLGLKLVGFGGAAEEQTGGSHDMCGGSPAPDGLVAALQHAGAEEAEAVHRPSPNTPYKLVTGQYGTSLQAGFNENAQGYNEEDLDKLAAF